MKKRTKINFKALIINTLLGFTVSAAVTVSVLGYIDEIRPKKECMWQDAYFGFEEENLPECTPTFTHALTQKEIEEQSDFTGATEDIKKINVTAEELENLKDINFLKKNFYIVDRRTDIVQNDIDAEKFLNMDFSLNKETKGPKILIFHTHSCEMFADSAPSKELSEGIWGVGERLKQILEEKYNIEVLHDDGRYDMVNGCVNIKGAYERMEGPIRKILDENPSIEVVIDMHRDGVNENTRLVTEQNGKKCAKIMFFNGLCRLNKNGSLESITSLPNKYITENLAFSFNMQLTANKLFPDFTRKIYANAYRYSLHMKPKSLLIEVGAQTNTKEEALNSMEILAQILASVLKAE